MIFAIDRAGVPRTDVRITDAEDLGFMRTMPNPTIMAPADKNELKRMFEFAWQLASPVVIRYPAAALNRSSADTATPLRKGRALVIREGGDAFSARDAELKRRCSRDKLAERGIAATVVNTRFLKPLIRNCCWPWRRRAGRHAGRRPDRRRAGGAMRQRAGRPPIKASGIFGWGDTLLEHGAPEKLRGKYVLPLTLSSKRLKCRSIMKIIIDRLFPGGGPADDGTGRRWSPMRIPEGGKLKQAVELKMK